MSPLTAMDRDALVGILAEQAATSADTRLYYRDLVDQANLPRLWGMSIAGTWTGDVVMDARRLLQWAEAKGVNPADPRFTTVGALLTASLPGLGLDRASTVVAVISARGLYRDAGVLRGLRVAYSVPGAPTEEAEPAPSVSWRIEPSEDGEVELEGLFKRDPDYLDVGFVSSAIRRSAAVCRVEAPGGRALGSGFLVGPDLVITNHHVISPEEGPAPDAKSLVLRFGCLSPTLPPASPERAIAVDAVQPVVRSSPTDELDFALLRLSARVAGVEPLLPGDGAVPERGGGVHLLQHPGGETMKLVLSEAGVREVHLDRHVVHYRSRTAGGSSGSPCFDDDWHLIAVHRAERSRPTGSIREGVLFQAVLERIGDEVVV